MTTKPSPARFVGLRLDDATRERVEALAPYLATRAPIRANFSGAARFLLLDALQRFEGEAKRNAKPAPDPSPAPPVAAVAPLDPVERFADLARQIVELRAEQAPLREMLHRLADALSVNVHPEEALALEAAAVTLHGRRALDPVAPTDTELEAFVRNAAAAKEGGRARGRARAADSATAETEAPPTPPRKWREHVPEAEAALEAVKAELAEARIVGNVNRARDLERRLAARETQLSLAVQLDDARRQREAHLAAGHKAPDTLEAAITSLARAYGGASRFEVE